MTCKERSSRSTAAWVFLKACFAHAAARTLQPHGFQLKACACRLNLDALLQYIADSDLPFDSDPSGQATTAEPATGQQEAEEDSEEAVSLCLDLLTVLQHAHMVKLGRGRDKKTMKMCLSVLRPSKLYRIPTLTRKALRSMTWNLSN